MFNGQILLTKGMIEDGELYTIFGKVEDSDFDYIIDIDLQTGVSLEDALTVKNLNSYLSAIRAAFVILDEDDKCLLHLLEMHKGEEEKLLTECRTIEFSASFSLEEVADCLKNCPSINNKDIIVNVDGVFGIDSTEKLELLFGSHEGTISFKLPLNKYNISLEDYKRTIDKIRTIVDKIKGFSLSPLEQVMYAYDMVRDREFKRENSWEDLRISRDLSTVLFGDRIVCEGFSNELKSILENLGIRCVGCDYVEATNSKSGHRRLAIYIKDDKYDVDGVYLFDPTWDAKKSGNDEYLNAYKFFGLTKDMFESLQNRNLRDITFGRFGYDLVELFKNYCERGIPYKIPESVVCAINAANSLVYGDFRIPLPQLINNPNIPSTKVEDSYLEFVVERAEDLVEKFDKPLSADILFKVLCVVREKEYYENPAKYPFSEEAIVNIVVNSNWIFDSEIDMYFLRIFNQQFKSLGKSTLDHMKEEGLDKRIAFVRLTRTLKSISETWQK